MSQETDSAMQMIDRHVNQLAEHFDSVRIICTLHSGSDDTSKSYSRGAGNFYAQQASVREQVLAWDEFIREHARTQQQDQP